VLLRSEILYRPLSAVVAEDPCVARRLRRQLLKETLMEPDDRKLIDRVDFAEQSRPLSLKANHATLVGMGEKSKISGSNNNFDMSIFRLDIRNSNFILALSTDDQMIEHNKKEKKLQKSRFEKFIKK